MPVTFQMLLTLVSSSNAENAETLWGFIGRYRPGVTPQTHPKLDALVGYAINYFRDFVLPDEEIPRADRRANARRCSDLRNALAQLPQDASAEDIQNVVYEIGRREPFLDHAKKGKDGRPGVSLDWFNMLYQVLLGQEKGPRFGSFVASTASAMRGDDRRGAERRPISVMRRLATRSKAGARSRLVRSIRLRHEFARLLARPDDPCDPLDVLVGKGAVAVARIERGKLDRFRRTAAQLLGHHLAVLGLHHHAVALADRSRRARR